MRNKIAYRREALVKIQKTVRGHLARRQHAPRYQGIVKIKGLETQLKQLEKAANGLKKDKQASLEDIAKIHQEMTAAIGSIKRNPKIGRKEIERLYNSVLGKANSEMGILQKRMQEQRNADEQDRLKKIQEEMEKERKRKEEEERVTREQEEIKKQ